MKAEQGKIMRGSFYITRCHEGREAGGNGETDGKAHSHGREVAANIAHEMRNPLGSIELFASLLMKDMKEQRHQGKLSHIITSVKNMDNKISNLLLFTTQKHPMMRKVNLHRIVKEVLEFSDPIIKQEDISLSVKYSGIESCSTKAKLLFSGAFLLLLSLNTNGRLKFVY